MNLTKGYYRDNSQEFFDSTVIADVTPLYDHFLKYVPEKGYILDLGCGSGRDTKAFLDKGYQVDAIDGSKELCSLASKYTGIAVKCMDFSSIDFDSRYDAIWACASLLHVGSRELPGMIQKLCKALHSDGVLYMSFKYGDFEGERDGRFFLDMTEGKFQTVIHNVDGGIFIEEWRSGDVRRGKDVNWYNVIMRKASNGNRTVDSCFFTGYNNRII